MAFEGGCFRSYRASQALPFPSQPATVIFVLYLSIPRSLIFQILKGFCFRVDDNNREQKLPLIRDVEDVISILRSDYDQAYFLTGGLPISD